MKKTKVWINKKFVGIDNARISIFDRGYLYGDGVFETMRSYAGRIFRLDEHLDRLFKALKIMRISPPYGKQALEKIIYKCLEVNGIKSGYIRLEITRGEGRFGISYQDDFKPNMVIVAKPFGEYPDWMYSRGIKAKVVAVRQNEYSPVSTIKSLNFLQFILARLYAKEDGYDEAILLNTKGNVAEAATSNIFLVKRESLVTPSIDSGILPGVTRRVIIEIAKKLKVGVRERTVSPRELKSADEIFLTNSLVEVMPVMGVNGRKVRDGKVGEITKLFHISYQKQVIRETLL